MSIAEGFAALSICGAAALAWVVAKIIDFIYNIKGVEKNDN